MSFNNFINCTLYYRGLPPSEYIHHHHPSIYEKYYIYSASCYYDSVRVSDSQSNMRTVHLTINSTSRQQKTMTVTCWQAGKATIFCLFLCRLLTIERCTISKMPIYAVQWNHAVQPLLQQRRKNTQRTSKTFWILSSSMDNESAMQFNSRWFLGDML